MSRGRLVVVAAAGLAIAVAIVIALAGSADPTPALRLEYVFEPDGSERSLHPGNAVDVIRRRIDRVPADGRLRANVWADDRIFVELTGADNETYATVRALIVRPVRLELARIDPDAEFFALLHAHTSLVSPPGIIAETEAWPRVTDRPITRDRFLRAGDRDTLERYLARSARDNPTYAPPPDRRIAYEAVDSPGGFTVWRTHVLDRNPWVTGASIHSAEVTFDPATNRPQVMVELDAGAAILFAEHTRSHVGDKLAIVLDDMVQSAPVIESAIPGGRIAITMGGGDPRTAERDATQIAAALASGELPGVLKELSATQFEVASDGVRWYLLAPIGLLAIALAIAGMVWRR